MNETEPTSTTGGSGQPDGCAVPGSFAAARAVLVEATAALRTLPGLVWQAGGADLADGLGELDAVAALAAAARFAHRPAVQPRPSPGGAAAGSALLVRRL